MKKMIISFLLILLLLPIGFSIFTLIPNSKCGATGNPPWDGCWDIESSLSNGDTWALGYTYIRKWNGTHFELKQNSPCGWSSAMYFFTDNYGHVATSFSSTCWKKWDGASWTAYPSDTNLINGQFTYDTIADIDCINNNFCIGVGSGGVYGHGSVGIWNGTNVTWNAYGSTNNLNLQCSSFKSVSCGNNNGDWCWFTCESATLLYYRYTSQGNGRPMIYNLTEQLPNWNLDPSNYLPTTRVYAVSNSSVWIIGADPDVWRCQVWHYDGSSFTNKINLTGSGHNPSLYMYDDNDGWFGCGSRIYHYKDGIFSVNESNCCGTRSIASIGVNIAGDDVFLGTENGIWNMTYHYGLPEEKFYCGQLGICTDNPMCLFTSILEFILGMILCIQPIFWLFLLGGIGLAVLLGMKLLSRNF